MRFTFSLLFCLGLLSLHAQNQVPVIQQLNTSVDWNTKILTITYDVQDAENDPLEISVFFSNNNGKTYALNAQVIATGDLGFPITPGSGHSISCDVSALAPLGSATFTVRLVADDKQIFDIQQLVNEVDSNRLKADMQFVEGVRHRTTGAAHLNAVRDSLRHLYEDAGLFREDQTFTYSGSTGYNISGTSRGTTTAEKVVIVDAHYDTVSNAPGADDNGSGTVGVMEIARLLSRYPSQKTLRFMSFDLEESGLVGSARYVTNGIPAGDQIEGVFNFEMIGFYSTEPNSQTLPTGFNQLFPAAYAQVSGNQFRGDFITNVGNVNSAALATTFNDAAAMYVPSLKIVAVNVPGTGTIAPDLRRSDHAPFWDGGYKALMLTDGANFRNECYHTASDTSENKLNYAFMADVTKATLAAAAQLAGIQHGDWATATFDGTVGSVEPAFDCDVHVNTLPSARNELIININLCEVKDLNIDLFDEKGVPVYTHHFDQPSAGSLRVSLNQSLPAGMYQARFSSGQQVKVQQLIIL